MQTDWKTPRILREDKHEVRGPSGSSEALSGDDQYEALTSTPSIHQSINQPVKQSISQHVNQSISQPVNQSISQPVNQPVNQSSSPYQSVLCTRLVNVYGGI